MAKSKQICLNCNKEFEVENRELKRGNGKFCCRSCAAVFNHPVKNQLPNCICALCNKQFYRNASKKTNAKKTGLQFCSRACCDKAKQVELALLTRSDATKIKYRNIAKRNYKQLCSICGYDKMPEILQVHHKDRDRTNNNISNLQFVCPNCHAEIHFKANDGQYTRSRNKKGL